MPGCTIGPDGNLLNAKDIQWYEDVDSSEPINLATTPSVMTFPPSSRYSPTDCIPNLVSFTPDYSQQFPRLFPIHPPRHSPFHFPSSFITCRHGASFISWTLTSLCLPFYLHYLVQYLDLLQQGFPRPIMYLTLASMTTKP